MNKNESINKSERISYGRFEILSNNTPHKVGSGRAKKSSYKNVCEDVVEILPEEDVTKDMVEEKAEEKVEEKIEEKVDENVCEEVSEKVTDNIARVHKPNYRERGRHGNRNRDKNFVRDRDVVSNKKQYRDSDRQNNNYKYNYNINAEVLKQRELNKNHKYRYNVLNNGNVENNSTIYVRTHVAHYYQIEKLLNDALNEAKSKPEIFGNDFDSDYKINHVLNHDLTYLGYVFIDVSNPKFYYALTGSLLDGTPNVTYKDDENWVPSEYDGSWGSEMDIVSPPKVEVRLPPLLSLGEYEYDDMQKAHMGKDQEKGMVTVSPAFVTIKDNDGFSPVQLYVSDVPANDIDFLMSLFARYARSQSRDNFPKINIREKDGKEGKFFATVKYGSEYDAAFALVMSKRIRVKYNDVNVVMSVRYALNR